MLNDYILETNNTTLLPITLSEAKQYCRLNTTDTEQDDLLTAIIKASVLQFESNTCMRIMESTYIMYLDKFPCFKQTWNCHIIIWKYPITSIESIQYIPYGETDYQTLEPENYEVTTEEIVCRIKFSDDLNLADKLNALKITFIAGKYVDDTIDEIPEDIKLPIKYLVMHLYENPSPVVSGTQINSVPLTYEFSIIKFINKFL